MTPRYEPYYHPPMTRCSLLIRRIWSWSRRVPRVPQASKEVSALRFKEEEEGGAMDFGDDDLDASEYVALLHSPSLSLLSSSCIRGRKSSSENSAFGLRSRSMPSGLLPYQSNSSWVSSKPPYWGGWRMRSYWEWYTRRFDDSEEWEGWERWEGRGWRQRGMGKTVRSARTCPLFTTAISY